MRGAPACGQKTFPRTPSSPVWCHLAWPWAPSLPAFSSLALPPGTPGSCPIHLLWTLGLPSWLGRGLPILSPAPLSTKAASAPGLSLSSSRTPPPAPPQGQGNGSPAPPLRCSPPGPALIDVLSAWRQGEIRSQQRKIKLCSEATGLF